MSTSTPNPFAGMTGLRSEDIAAEDFLKIAIIGAQKSGKSWFAATAPGPVRYYDWDNRKESLEGKSNLYISSAPQLTMLDVERDLSLMKAEKVRATQQKTTPNIPKTVVHDTVTLMKFAMEAEIRRQSPGLFRSIRVGNSTTVYVGADWDVVNGIQRYFEYLIAEYTGLGINQIYVFHERDEKDKGESTPNKPVYTGLLTIDPQFLAASLSHLNEIYHITLDANKPGGKVVYEVECKPTTEIHASTTLLLDAKEPPNIMAMIQKHRDRRAAQQKA